MRVSQIGLVTTRLEKLHEQFPVQDMMTQTGQLMQYGSGIYGYGHVPYLLKKKIQKVICDVFKEYELVEVSLPLLQPENIWIKSGRLQRYVDEDIMFRCLTDNGNYCMAPTAEEAVVEFASARITSYKQLPVTFFQIGEKFRNEIRSRGFLLRGKSFDMMDAYSFGRDQADLDKDYDRIKEAYFEVFRRLGLDVMAVAADNGAIGGSKSEEFMCLSNIGEDTILFDETTKKAFNSELLEREDVKEYLKNEHGIENLDNISQRKAVELGHIFQLGDKYASTMDLTYTDKDGKPQYVVMGCYGIGVSRTLALIYENSAVVSEDGKFLGIALPKSLSPYLLYIVPKQDGGECEKVAKEAYDALTARGVEVLYDDRGDASIGAKIKDSKVVGTPYVAVFGKTLENGVIDIEDNKTGEKVTVKIEEFVDYVTSLKNN